MSDQELSDARGRNTQRISRQKSARRRSIRTALTGVLVAGLTLSGAGIASADVGGGGVGGGPNGGGGLASEYWLFTGDTFGSNDQPMQGWGTASIHYFADTMEQYGGWVNTLGSDRSGMVTACTDAINQAITRSNGASTRARVIQVGVSVGEDNGGFYMGWGGSKSAMTTWYNQQSNASGWHSLVPHYDASLRSAVHDAYISAIPETPRIVCIALNDTEVPNYDLSLSTDKQGEFAVAGSSGAVYDRIHATASSSVREDLTARVSLRWGGVEGTDRTVNKNVTIANHGSTNSPNFRPADFGWTSWPAGKFWFNVTVAKQGGMKDAVSHLGASDSRENWTATKTAPRKVLTSGAGRDVLADDEVLAAGQAYNAEISAGTNGYTSSMTITDTIQTSSVWIGSASADVASAVYVEDPSGNRVANATVNISRTSTRVVVTGTVTDIPDAFQSRQYTLVVPTFLRPSSADYSITDQSRVCYTAAETDCIAGNNKTTRKVTATPDKLWVINESGALAGAAGSAEGKTFAPGHGIGAVVNGSVPAKLAENLSRYELVDDWTAAAAFVDFTDPTKAKVFVDGIDRTAWFTITVEGTTTRAVARAAFLNTTKGSATAKSVKLFVGGTLRADYDTDGEKVQITNAGSERWNDEVVNTNVAAVFTATPRPNKVWVLDEDGALIASDKYWLNDAGADNRIFLANDAVAAVVNGSIPADLAAPLDHYSIADDWTDAAAYVDFSDAALTKVFYDGVDVTRGFTVNVEGTRTTAVAGPAFLAATAGLERDGEVKLVVAGFFRDDFDTDGQVVTLTNSGEETWNTRTQKSNSPAVYAWTPNPNKQVLGSADESGDRAHDDINGSSVWPGQKLEYSVGIDLRIPAGTARGVKTLAVEDVYDPYFIVDKTSVEFWDSRNPANPRPVARSAYKLTFDDANHSFRAEFTDAWLAQNLAEEGANSRWLTQGWLTMRVTGTVSRLAPAGSTVVNQAFQVINGARTGTDVPAVSIPAVAPDKQSLSTDELDIDGKTVVEGDVIVYRLLLDARPARSELAYNVHKLGIVDDFDDEYLDVAAEDILVTEKATGDDVTSRFNVQVSDGIAYVFAKTVDTEGVYGGIIAGDPQPGDLKAFDEAPIRPLEDAIIDQSLLGKEYWVTIPAQVTKEQAGHVIENQARQNVQNTHTTTRIVSNPLGDIDPSKDVVVSEESGDESIEGTEIRMNTAFNYRLNSSEIPADRAYAAKRWTLADTFDRVHDQYTGIWAIYASTDLYDGADRIFAKGELLQKSTEDDAQAPADLFDVEFDQDSYTLQVTATQKYLDLVGSRDDLAQAFTVYAKVLRIAPGKDIQNQVFENYNGTRRESNLVDTFTIEYPGIAVAKYTASEGKVEGSHGDLASAQEMTEDELAFTEVDGTKLQNGIGVGITFGNSGDVPLKDVTFVDYTHDGRYGQLQGIRCAVPADPTAPGMIAGDSVATPDADGLIWVLPSTINELSVAEEVSCRGTLRGMERGMTHADTVLVTGKSVFTDALVKGQDSWFAYAASLPGINIVEYTFDEGIKVGDRNEVDDALELTADQAENGVKVAFDITNTGDEPLTKLQFSNAAKEGTTGKVSDVKWLQPVPELVTEPEEEPAPAGDETGAPTSATAVEGAETKIVEYNDVEYYERDLAALKRLEIGETVLLMGTLTGVKPATTHTDHAKITAAGAYSGVAVDNDDPWNAKRVAAPAKPPVGVVAGEVLAASESRKSLLYSSALLMAAAAVVSYILRRRGGRSAR